MCQFFLHGRFWRRGLQDATPAMSSFFLSDIRPGWAPAALHAA
jgi:hypothetical protein